MLTVINNFKNIIFVIVTKKAFLLAESMRLDVDIQRSLEHVEHFQMLIQYFSITLQYICRNSYMKIMPKRRWYAL